MKELGRIITLPKIFDPRGNLTVAEGESHIPFAIARTYWTYDVPGKGGHVFLHAVLNTYDRIL